jgi:chromosome segregation ATPase
MMVQRKRGRLSMRDRQDDVFDDDDNTVSIAGVSNEVDELTVELEHWHNKYATLEDEFKRFQDKHSRQMGFMETEVSELKTALAASNDKYFEEKKKWQAKLRALEAKATGSEVPTSSLSSLAAEAQGQLREMLERIGSLETKLQDKSSENRKLSLANADLESRLARTLKQASLVSTNQILSASSFEEDEEDDMEEDEVTDDRNDVDGSPRSQFAARTRDSVAQDHAHVHKIHELTKKCTDLELALSKKHRELHKLQSKMQNSAMLESEVDALKTKIGLLEKKIAATERMESEYKTLQLEKQEWTSLLQSAVSVSAGPGPANAPDQYSSPAMLIRALSAAQKKCAQLVASETSLHSKLAIHKQTVEMLERELESAKQVLAQSQEELTKQAAKQRLLQHQSSSFEREVKNLRVMLSTYEAEAQLGQVGGKHSAQTRYAAGQPAQASEDQSMHNLVKRKEAENTALRSELDEIRASNKQLVEQLTIKDEEMLSLKRRLQRDVDTHGQYKDASMSATAVVEDDNLDYDPQTVKVRRVRVYADSVHWSGAFVCRCCTWQ